jgi:hypothetical protein
MRLYLILVLASRLLAQPPAVNWTHPDPGALRPKGGSSYQNIWYDKLSQRSINWSGSNTDSGYIFSTVMWYYDAATGTWDYLRTGGPGSDPQGADIHTDSGSNIDTPTWPGDRHPVISFVDTKRNRYIELGGSYWNAPSRTSGMSVIISGATVTANSSIPFRATGVGNWVGAAVTIAGTSCGTIVSVQDATHLTLSRSDCTQGTTLFRFLDEGNNHPRVDMYGLILNADPQANTWTRYDVSADISTNFTNYPLDENQTGFGVHDPIADVYVVAGYYAYVYCPTDLNPTPGTLTTAQSNAGCAAADAWKRTTTQAPPAIYAYTLAWDPNTKRILKYGGTSGGYGAGGTWRSEVWSYETTTQTWTQKTMVNAPPVVTDTFLKVQSGPFAYDTKRRVFHYYHQTTQSDWEYDPVLDSWQRVGNVGGGSPQSTGLNTAMTYDAANDSLVVSEQGNGSTTWVGQMLGIQGVGASTGTCKDKDGDGYGQGPSCTGPDADDDDASVQTLAHGISKYTTFANFLSKLGYFPPRVFVVSSAGNDTSGASCTPATWGSCVAFRTFAKVNTLVAAGDLVLGRTHVITEAIETVSGTAGANVTYTAYPGERPEINALPNKIQMNDRHDVEISGFYVHNGDDQCIGGGGFSQDFANITYRENWFSGCGNGIRTANGLSRMRVEGNYIEDSDTHAIYLGSRERVSSRVLVRGNVMNNNGYRGGAYPAFQFNGRVTALLMEQNVTADSQGGGVSLTQGVNDSFVRSHVSINDAYSMLRLFTYDGKDDGITANCGVSGTDPCTCPPAAGGHNLNSICAYSQRNNLFENMTSYQTGKDHLNQDQSQQPTILLGRSCSVSTGCAATDMASNTFRNIVLMTAGAAHYPPIIFKDTATPLSIDTTTVDGIVYKTAGETGFLGYGFAGGGGYNAYGCGAAGAFLGALTGTCSNSDPLFVAASTSWYASSGAFDLRLKTGSPAVASGSATAVPLLDVRGTPLTPGAAAPNMGAYAGSQGATASGTVYSGRGAVSGVRR